MIHRFCKPALGGVLAVALVANSAFAAPTVDDDALKLDQSIQLLKEEALNIKASQQNAEDDLLYPDATRTVVYLSVPATALLVTSVSISIDDGPSVEVVLDKENTEPTEAIALQNGGLLTIRRANVPAGTHKLLAEVVSHYKFKESDDKKAFFNTKFKTDFEKTDDALSLELVLASDSYGRMNLTMHEWKAAK